MEIKQEIILDSATPDGCFSIKKQNYIEIDGQRNYVGQPERRAFCPGEFEEIEVYAPELMPMAQAIWTDEIIAAWQEQAQSPSPGS